MNYRTMLVAAMGAVMMGAAQAGTYHWTGAVDGCWTNAANWAEAKIPGQYYGATGAKTGSVGDTVYFDSEKLTGNAVTTISFDGVYSVSNLFTTGTARFTYGTAAGQNVPIEAFGTFSAAETATTPVATVSCRLQMGVDCPCTGWGSDKLYVRNNSAEEFVIGEWGYSTKAAGASGGEPHLYFDGTGSMRITKAAASCGAGSYRINAGLRGPLTIDAPYNPRVFSVHGGTLGIYTPLNVIITANGALGGSTLAGDPEIWRTTVFSGEGTYYFRYGLSGNAGKVGSSSICSETTFLCPVANKSIGTPPADFTTRMSLWGTVKTVKFAGGSSIQGTVYMTYYPWSGDKALQYAIIAADNFGKAGTFGDVGDVDFRVVQGALRHTGATLDEMDRAIAVTNRAADAAGYVILDQSGVGAWQVTSPVTLLGESTTAELRLVGDGAGAAAFRGSLANGVTVTKSGTGAWTFAPQNGFSGAVTLNGGTFALEQDATLASVTVSGAATLAVAAGKTVTISALTISDGKTLDVVTLDDAAAVKLPNAAAVPTGVTLNGHAAKLENGALVCDPSAMAEDVWKAATDGSWTDGTKWYAGTAPDGSKPVSIDANGADYTVTLDSAAGSSLTLTNLVVENAGAGTATLKVKGVDLTLCGIDKSRLALALGVGGAVDVEDATLTLTNRTSGADVLGQKGGSLTLRGSSTLVDGSPSTITFGTGATTFRDSAHLTKKSSGITYVITPSAAGETSEVSFLDSSYLAFSSKPWELAIKGNGGLARLTIDSGYANWMYNNFATTHVGSGSGVGELLLKRGMYMTGDWSYFYVGEPSSGCAATGRVEIAKDAKFYTEGNQPLEWNYKGVQIGCATSFTDASTQAYGYGELRIDGSYEQNCGVFFVACGPWAEADVFHSGTAKVCKAAYKNGGNGSSYGTDKLICAVAIGAFGGMGRYTMTDGTFDTGLNVYVGGIQTNDLNRPHSNGAILANRHDAQGTLSVSGGTFATTNSVILGRDGTGVLKLSGAGVVKAKEIVVSNTVGQAASEIRFVVGADGTCGKIDAATKLKFEPGARVVVDVSAVSAENPKSVKIWNLDEAPEGLDESMIEVVGGGSIEIENKPQLTNGGRRLAWRVMRGMVMIVR